MRIDARRIFKTPTAVAALAAAILLPGCATEPPAADAAPPPSVEARVLIAELTAAPIWSEASGGIEPWAQSQVATKIMGRIERVRVREGDVVRRGQPLVELEKRDLDAAVATAAAAVAMAQAQLENARVQHERIVALHSRGSVTDKNLEDATAAHRVAKAGLAQAEAARAQAEVMLDYAVLRAPRGGQVSARLVEVGDLANPGVPLLVLEDTRRVKVAVSVSESAVVGLARGARAEVAIDALDAVYDAQIDRILPAGDPRSRSYELQLVLENSDGALRSGMFARARIPRGERDALMVPASAVVRRGELTGLFRVTDQDIAELTWVRLGIARAGQVEVISGLAAGERFLESAPAGIVDGSAVRAR